MAPSVEQDLAGLRCLIKERPHPLLLRLDTPQGAGRLGESLDQVGRRPHVGDELPERQVAPLKVLKDRIDRYAYLREWGFHKISGDTAGPRPLSLAGDLRRARGGQDPHVKNSQGIDRS